MFTFNFDRNNEEKKPISIRSSLAASAKLLPSVVNSLADFSKLDNSVEIQFEGVADKMLLIDPLKMVEHLKNVADNQTVPALQADTDGSDLLPGIYEGGMKIWESTYDLANYLLNLNPKMFESKSVLDLGCGCGIMGILGLQLGSSLVAFQDYNEEVLRYLTIPNARLNCPDYQERCIFWSGDWDNFNVECSTEFDVILTSETTYNPDNYDKLHNVIKSKLKPSGVAFVAGKSYYFGVGGSMEEFSNLVKSEGVFHVTSVWTTNESVKREILRLKR